VIDSVIFNSPLLLVLYGIALALALIELKIKATGYVMPIISFAIAVGTSIYAILLGAGLFEIAIPLVILLLLNLFGARRKTE